MDYLDLVRRALTKPSGGLIFGVSCSEWRNWVSAAEIGLLKRIYTDMGYTITPDHIRAMAIYNTSNPHIVVGPRTLIKRRGFFS